jgi:putative ABC transport system substrate-binding protein
MIAKMKRREFITLLGGAAAAWPFAARAQKARKPVIGFLHTRAPVGQEHLVTAFHAGLRESGYFERHNVSIEYRWANGKLDQLPELAAELVNLPVDALVAFGGHAASIAAKGATTTVPIVFTTAVDPVAAGFVASLSRPGGNMTGVARQSTEIVSKRQGLLHDLLPNATRVAWLVNTASADSEAERTYVQLAANALGQKIQVLNVRAEDDIEAAFAMLEKAEALLVSPDAFFLSQRNQIVALAARRKVPTIYVAREYVEAGGLMSYGPSLADAYRLVGIYAGRILKGDRPADLPVVQPTKFELVINLKTAKALGLTVPDKLLVAADEVIE